ncbi:MAG: hypothetical protein H6917_04180 [Novosphingobium sp.]|nr:hypothetical protein [Novosphingobium sp.]MCP5401571.1 hypothetical protein [Novosphingobium sp.]
MTDKPTLCPAQGARHIGLAVRDLEEARETLRARPGGARIEFATPCV